MTKRTGLTLVGTLLCSCWLAGAAWADKPRAATLGERVSTWLNPVRYHRAAGSQTLVEHGLENGRRVTLGTTRQLSPSKAYPDGVQVQAVYGRLRLDGVSHRSRMRTLRTPDGLAKHTLVVRGFRGAEVKRLSDAGFDTSTIKAGTLKLSWQEKEQNYRALTPIEGVGKMLWGSKVTRASLLTGALGLSSWTFGLLHTAQAAVSLKLASMATNQGAVRRIGAIADFRPRGVPEQRMSTRLPGVGEAVSSMINAAP